MDMTLKKWPALNKNLPKVAGTSKNQQNPIKNTWNHLEYSKNVSEKGETCKKSQKRLITGAKRKTDHFSDFSNVKNSAKGNGTPTKPLGAFSWGEGPSLATWNNLEVAQDEKKQTYLRLKRFSSWMVEQNYLVS